jgi:hypothetical protein
LAAVHRFAALIIASAVAITPAQAQTASELRISGTVEKLDGNLAALSLSRGISLVVRLDSESARPAPERLLLSSESGRL